jgi:hypothetical protein
MTAPLRPRRRMVITGVGTLSALAGDRHELNSVLLVGKPRGAV